MHFEIDFLRSLFENWDLCLHGLLALVVCIVICVCVDRCGHSRLHLMMLLFQGQVTFSDVMELLVSLKELFRGLYVERMGLAC